jgi:hypothetical protein
MRELAPEEEIELRRIANQSLSVDPKLARRLAQLGLVERPRDGWHLTPLGRQHYMQLARPPLRQRSPAYIEKLLDRAIPLARAAGIPQPDPVPRPAEDHVGDARDEEMDSNSPGPVDLAESDELRSKCLKALTEFRESVCRTKTENDRAVAKSRQLLNRSWLLLTKTVRTTR